MIKAAGDLIAWERKSILVTCNTSQHACLLSGMYGGRWLMNSILSKQRPAKYGMIIQKQFWTTILIIIFVLFTMAVYIMISGNQSLHMPVFKTALLSKILAGPYCKETFYSNRL